MCCFNPHVASRTGRTTPTNHGSEASKVQTFGRGGAFFYGSQVSLTCTRASTRTKWSSKTRQGPKSITFERRLRNVHSDPGKVAYVQAFTGDLCLFCFRAVHPLTFLLIRFVFNTQVLFSTGEHFD